MTASLLLVRLRKRIVLPGRFGGIVEASGMKQVVRIEATDALFLRGSDSGTLDDYKQKHVHAT